MFIYSETPGDYVQLTFTQLAFEEDYDFLEIYDNVSGDQIAYFDFCPSTPTTVTATNGGGLEVYFYSDSSNEVGECGYGGFTATISCVPAEAGVLNDDCANAIPLSCGDVVTGSTTNATLDGPTADCTGGLVAPDVWYTIIGNGADITASLCSAATDYDTQIDIYTGSCGGLNSLTCNDDSYNCNFTPFDSEITWTSIPIIYYIRIHGYSGQTGNFELSITSTANCNEACTLEAGAGEDVTICQGLSTDLAGSFSGTAGSVVTYEWSPTTGLDDPYIANPTANPTTTTTYTLTVSTGEDCYATDEVTVTVNPAPPAAVTGTTSVCEGGVIVLIASGGNCYLWTGPDGYSSVGHSFSRTLATPEMSGLYTVSVGFLNCYEGEVCPATAAVYVTVHPKPVDTITGASPVCSGGSISLSAPGGAVAYAWSGPGGFTASGSTMTRNNASSLMSGLYKVTVTGAGGCTSTASKSVVVSAATTAAISGASSFCSGNTISLTATTAGASYQWSGPGGFSFSGANMTRGPATSAMAGTYTLTVTDTGGCIATKSKAITISASPTATISAPLGLNPKVNGKIYLIASGGNSYSWSGPGGFSYLSSVLVRQPATYAMCGLYTVTVTGSGGCTASASVFVTVGGYCGSEKTSGLTVETLTAYPNPGSNGLTQISFTAAASERASLSVYAIDGREVSVLFNDITVAGSPYSFDLNTGALASGIYFVVLRTKSGSTQQLRLVVTN